MYRHTLFNTDMPDVDVIRVNGTYYMVSTTMFFMPGAPILASKDLVHWKISSYVFTTIEDNEIYRLENGKNAYGKGQWATSLAYRNGRFYACFVCHDMAKTFIYSTDDVTKTGWEKIADMDEVFHDMSFLFWQDRAFLAYDNGDIKIVELKDDLTGVKENGLRKLLFKAPSEGIGLRAEGCRAIVKGDYIYMFFIDLPKNGIRRELCYRSKELEGPYEYKIIFEETLGLDNCGVAQGVIIDDEEGNWHSILFQDRGGSGRIPFLFNVKWEEDWPIIDHNPVEVDLKEYKALGLFSDKFLDENGKLHKAWQWNHNPDESCVSFDAIHNRMRLTTGYIAKDLMDARNTLTHRTIEPGCSFVLKMDASHLKDGDYAGICAFQGRYGQIGLYKGSDGLEIVVKEKKNDGNDFSTWTAGLEENQAPSIYFKIDYDFGVGKDKASFYYSFDEKSWNKLGDDLQMVFTLDLFVGYRTGIFYYATKETGGYVDILSTKMV